MDYFLAQKRFDKMFDERKNKTSNEYLEIVFNYGINLLRIIEAENLFLNKGNIENKIQIVSIEIKNHLEQLFLDLEKDMKNILNYNKDELIELLIIYKKIRLYFIDHNKYFNQKNKLNNKLEIIGIKLINQIERIEKA